MNDDTRYTSAVGKIRALEVKLIGTERFIQMCEADSAEEAVELLSDTDYGPSLSELKDIRYFEDALKKEAKKTIELISFLSDDPELTDVFRLRVDFNNLKVLLKAKHFSDNIPDSIDRHLREGGVVSPEKLKGVLKSGSIYELPVELSFIVRKIEEELRENKDPQLIDFALDNEFFSLLEKRVGESHLLRKWLERLVDLLNIKNFLRARSLKKGKDFLEKAFLPGGNLEKKLFVSSIGEREEDFSSYLPPEYKELVSQGIKYYEENNSWKELERLSDDYVMDALSEAKWVSFGIEPLIAYLFARENEMKNIRVIIAGKLNGVPAELLRATLRKTYA